MEFSKAIKPVLRLPFRSRVPLAQSIGRPFTTSSTRSNPTDSSNSNAPPPSLNKDAKQAANDVSKSPAPADTLANTTNNGSASEGQAKTSPTATTPNESAKRPLASSNLVSLVESFQREREFMTGSSSSSTSSRTGGRTAAETGDKNAPLHSHAEQEQPWHLHVYSHKHNTHLTLSRPNRRAVISISAGNIGFRKAQRGSHDAAFQLGAYMMARINRAGLLAEMDRLEVAFRGFGSGREAMYKILLGSEGSVLRDKISRVVDTTRLKFGGTRSKAPRRLG